MYGTDGYHRRASPFVRLHLLSRKGLRLNKFSSLGVVPPPHPLPLAVVRRRHSAARRLPAAAHSQRTPSLSLGRVRSSLALLATQFPPQQKKLRRNSPKAVPPEKGNNEMNDQFATIVITVSAVIFSTL